MTTLANRDGRPTAYEMLVVHPNAPADLIATVYWLLAGHLLKRRDAGEYVDDTLHGLTRAYECISDPIRRSAYDATLGHTGESLARRPLARVRRSTRVPHDGVPGGRLDHYEVLGLSASAPPEVLPAAYEIMRTQYLRVPEASQRRRRLLEALDDAYATLSVSEERRQYDERAQQEAVEQSGPPPPQDQDAQSRRPTGHVLRGLGRALAAGARLPNRGLRNGQGAHAADPATGKPEKHPAKQPAPPEPPITREPAPRSRNYSIDVEEVLLGRIASYAEERRSPHMSAESGEGGDAPPNAQP